VRLAAGFPGLGPREPRARGLFFKATRPFGAGLLDDQLGILTHQQLELLVVGSVLGDHLRLVCRNIACEGFAAFTTLEVVIRPIGSLADDAKFSRLHALDPGNLL